MLKNGMFIKKGNTSGGEDDTPLENMSICLHFFHIVVKFNSFNAESIFFAELNLIN